MKHQYKLIGPGVDMATKDKLNISNSFLAANCRAHEIWQCLPVLPSLAGQAILLRHQGITTVIIETMIMIKKPIKAFKQTAYLIQGCASCWCFHIVTAVEVHCKEIGSGALEKFLFGRCEDR